MRFALLPAILAFSITVKCTTTVTFELVQPPGITDGSVPSRTFVAGGLGPDGLATLSLEFVRSENLRLTAVVPVVTNGVTESTKALFSTSTISPLTAHGTIVADASHYAITYAVTQYSTVTGSPPAVAYDAMSCDLDGKGGGSCVERHWVGSDSGITRTFTGTAVPFYTAIYSGGGSANSGYAMVPAFQLAVVWSVVSTGVLLGMFLGL